MSYRFEQLSQLLFISGYESEHSRLQNMDIQCKHHKFPSIVKYIHYIVKSTSLNKTVIDTKWRNLIGGGCCKGCCLYLATNLKEINLTNYNKTIVAKTTKHVHRLEKPEDLELMSCLLINMLQYAQTAQVLFRYNFLWVEHFNSLLKSLVRLNYACEIEMEQRMKLKTIKNYERVYADDVERGYHQCAITMYQTLRNLHFMSPMHWKCLMKPNYGRSSDTFLGWIKFVKQQLKYKLYLEYKFGVECMHSMAVIICIGIKYLKLKWFNKMVKNKEFGSKWFNELKIMFNNNYINNIHCNVMNNFIILSDKNDLIEMYDKCCKWGNDVYKLKRNYMLCQNISCHFTRIDLLQFNRKMYKCKKCKIARYCSKHCQKCDWKKYHKNICKKLRKMKIHRETEWKRVKKEIRIV